MNVSVQQIRELLNNDFRSSIYKHTQSYHDPCIFQSNIQYTNRPQIIQLELYRRSVYKSLIRGPSFWNRVTEIQWHSIPRRLRLILFLYNTFPTSTKFIWVSLIAEQGFFHFSRSRFQKCLQIEHTQFSLRFESENTSAYYYMAIIRSGIFLPLMGRI